MVFPIAGGNESKGYEVSNSIRLDDGSNSFLSKSFGSDGNRRTFTFSCWTKGQADSSAYHSLFTSGNDNPDTSIWFNPDEALRTNTYNSGSIHDVITNRVFRDPSAWYHIVVAYDTTQSTASNRVKIYVNGVQETSFSTSSYPDQNYETFINDASYTHRVGSHTSSAYAGDGYLCEVAFIDGTQYAASNFGEFDDNGVWIPKDFKNDVTFGSNGFYLEFKQTGTSADSSGIGADTSGNDNHFAVTNLAATDITEDTCTNNFATMNPVESDRQQGGAATFAEGNLQITTSYVDANYQRYPQVYSTQAASSGKWYFEMKIADSDTDSAMGIHSPDNYSSDSTTNPYGGYATTSCIYTSRGAVRINDGNNTGHGTWSQNDIIGCALDIDNSKVYFHKNGTYIQSGDPAGNSGGQAIPSGYTYGFTVGADAASDSGIMQVNFGNPIHTISSGNTDGKYGNFEYAVPSGFYAVCTKRLAEFG